MLVMLKGIILIYMLPGPGVSKYFSPTAQSVSPGAEQLW